MPGSRSDPIARVGVLWRGRPGSGPPPRAENRLRAIFDELEAQGAATEALVFSEEAAEEIRRRIAALDAVLVWVDPIVGGRDRTVLDAILREAAAEGVYVSAHPDVILKMGTKDVLVRTKEMAWGSDTHLVGVLDELRTQLLERLRSGPRVLKQHRGSGGNGVWKVELLEGASRGREPVLRVLHAARGSHVEELSLSAFVERCAPYFAAFGGSGCLIDQPYESRLDEGMIRCYLSRDRVVGFGHQFVTALLPPPSGTRESPPPPPRYYFGPTKPEFQELKTRLESGWVAEMQRLCDVSMADLPVIWDADFLFGPKADSGSDTYVLCELNVSGVFPIPDEAVAPLARTAIERAVAGRG